MNQNNIQLAMEAGRVFTPAAPINETDLFAGRTKQIRAVIDAVSQRGQHAIIFGERGVGKTSLVNVLVEFVGFAGPASGPVIAPRVNCDSSDNFTTIWRKIFSEIPYATIEQPIGFGGEPNYQSFDLSSALPDPVTPDSVRRLLTQISNENGVQILIVDEFDRVADEQAPALFADTIKNLSDHSVAATLVLVGVADSVDELIAEHESIERPLVQIQMPRMSSGELNQIVLNGLERLNLEIEEDALSDITSLSQGLPHYTHLLGLHSSREAIDDESRRIRLPHVEAAIRQALEGAQQSIRNAYHKATLSPRKDNLYRQVLLACALAHTDELGYFSPANVREPMTRIMNRPYDIPSFSRHLRDFSGEQRGPILQKTGPERRTRYRFINPLLQPYVTMLGVNEGLVDRYAIADLRGDDQ